MADPTRDIDSDADEDGIDAAALVRRLTKINGILTKAQNRLSKIDNGYLAPPTGDRPPVVTALSAIRTTAQAVDALAAGLLAKTPVGGV